MCEWIGVGSKEKLLSVWKGRQKNIGFPKILCSDRWTKKDEKINDHKETTQCRKQHDQYSKEKDR